MMLLIGGWCGFLAGQIGRIRASVGLSGRRPGRPDVAWPRRTLAGVVDRGWMVSYLVGRGGPVGAPVARDGPVAVRRGVSKIT